MVDSIRIKAGKRLLKKELKKKKDRKVVACNIKQASSLAFLFKITNQDDYRRLQKLEKVLKKEYGIKEVFSLGYIDDKKIEDFLRPSVSFDFLKRKELRWNGMPSGDAYKNFIAKEYDLLIDLTNYDNIPLRYTLVNSKAKLKVGRYSEENEPFYDLMISCPNDNFEEFVKQALHYLNMLQP